MLKKIGIAIAAVIVILAAIIMIRAALFTSKQLSVKPVERADINIAGSVEHLSRAIQIRTISNQDMTKFDKNAFHEFNAYLDRTFPRVHDRLKRETVNGYSLLYTWKGSNPKAKPALLMAHSDVVPIEPGTENKWTHEPFSGAVADGFIWGRGSLDDKINVISILESIEYLLSQGFQPRRTFYMAIGHTEEVRGAEGNGKIEELLAARGVRLEMVVDEGGFISNGLIGGITAPVAMIGTAEKGYLSLELSVAGEGGHSSMPPQETAVGILCTAVSRLSLNQYPLEIKSVTKQLLETIGPEMPFGSRLALANLWLLGGVVKSRLGGGPSMASAMHTTIAPTMLQGSVKENVLPSRATAVVNFRIMPGDTIKSVIERVRAVIKDKRVKISVMPEAKEPSPVSDSGSRAYDALNRSVLEVFPGVIVTPFLFIAATDSRFYIPISDGIYRFSPLQFRSEDLKRLHGTNERIAVNNFRDIIRFYIRLIRNVGGM